MARTARYLPIGTGKLAKRASKPGPYYGYHIAQGCLNNDSPDTWSKLRKQSWARLLQKVYEVDPFICPKCQGAMSVVAIIEDPKELGKIIEWANQQEKEPRLTLCARSPPELALATV